jgi:hypothetical protein
MEEGIWNIGGLMDSDEVGYSLIFFDLISLWFKAELLRTNYCTTLIYCIFAFKNGSNSFENSFNNFFFFKYLDLN